jgi:plasmid stabilization system protein ParE
MAKTIVWNNKASIQFNAVIEYLETEWGEKVTKSFVVRTYQIIEILAQYPEIGTLENPDKRIRAFVITKHNTLFYRVDNDKLYLLNFFDNRQHPQRKSNI